MSDPRTNRVGPRPGREAERVGAGRSRTGRREQGAGRRAAVRDRSAARPGEAGGGSAGSGASSPPPLRGRLTGPLLAGLALLCGCDSGPGAGGVGTPPGAASSAGVELLARVAALHGREMEPLVERSLREAEAAVRADPRSGAAWEELGLRLDAHGLWAEARGALEEALACEPGRFAAAYDLAVVLGLLGEPPEDVWTALRRASELRPAYGAARVREAAALADLGRLDEARQVLEEVLASEPHRARARARLGVLWVDLEQPERARAELEVVLAEHPDDRPSLAALARAERALGNDARAAELAARAERAHGETTPFEDPVRFAVLERSQVSSALAERAARRAAAGDAAGAAELLGQALEAQPAAFHARAERARFLMALGRGDEARAELDRVLEERPEHVVALQLRGQWLCERERFGEAVAVLERAAALDGLEPASLVAWGMALGRLERFDEGALRLQEALDLQPGNHDVRWRRALLLELGGDLEAALDAYAEARSLSPSHPLAARADALRARSGR